MADALSADVLIDFTAATITNAESAVTNKPIAIFAGVDGSLPLRRKKPNMPTTKGVNTITQNGLMD